MFQLEEITPGTAAALSCSPRLPVSRAGNDSPPVTSQHLPARTDGTPLCLCAVPRLAAGSAPAAGKADPVPPSLLGTLPGALGCGHVQCQGQDHGVAPTTLLSRKKEAMRPQGCKGLLSPNWPQGQGQQPWPKCCRSCLCQGLPASAHPSAHSGPGCPTVSTPCVSVPAGLLSSSPWLPRLAGPFLC